jgi:hypothetical protein
MDAQTLDPPRRILFSWTITAYLRTRPPRAVVRVRRSDATMGAVLAACGRARVSSVLANDGDDDGDDDDWWMIGVRDVTRAFINAYYDTATTREDDDDDDDDAAHARAHADDFYDEFWRSSAWEYGRRASVMRERHATSRTLLDVVDALRDEPLVVVNVVDGGRVVDVITRFDIVEFLHRHVKILGDITTALVSRLFRAKNVLRAPARASALACVRDMVREDVSAIALTDDDGGEICANFSINDLRRIESPAALARLCSCSALEFVSSARSREADFSDADVAPFADERRRSASSLATPPTHAYVELIFARAECTTFGEVLALMHVHKVHRVYVLSKCVARDRDVCANVLTPTDVIRALAI